MITLNVDKLLEDLDRCKKEIDRKMENMVRGFVYTISQTAIQNTPLGNAEEFFKIYQSRQQRLGLQPVEGFARGSWQVSKTGQFSVQQIYTVNSGATALSLIKSDLSSYKLGDEVYIGNKGYYIRMLEGGYSDQAPMGIMKPTTDQIMASYRVDLKRLFDQG